ncbi:MAG: hypothetical protein IKO15_05390 [Clostridiales bacterium]|nr:hypothetical protein [Clostridiales bacterium]
METVNKHIMQEYLALKINYCRSCLEKLPKVKLQLFGKDKKPVQKVIVGNHRYMPDSVLGEKYLKIMQYRDTLQRKLEYYESVWNCKYKDIPFPECVPHRVVRTMFAANGTRVVMNKEFFDSLKNDANTKYPKPTSYPFNGIYYRSAAEREIAIFYTEMGIPFKYEPEMTIMGVPGFIYPDFVIYILELDNCKIHEHFGMKESSTYLKSTCNKYQNYTNAGLVPELDVIFTHDVEEIPFDIRALSSKVNTSIYTTMIGTKQIKQPPLQ